MSGIEAIIDRQIRRWEAEKALRAQDSLPQVRLMPVITVSRQRASGGSMLAERLARHFDYTLLHRQMIDHICRSSGTVRRIVESLDEHAKSEVTVWVDAMLGMDYMDADDYAKHLLHTIRSIARLGGVVVVGRGSNFLVGPEHGFHLRVVAPRDVRVRRLVERGRHSPAEAARQVDSSDHERREFVRRLYRRDINDVEAYDLVINTGILSIDAAADLAAEAAARKFEILEAAMADRQPA